MNLNKRISVHKNYCKNKNTKVYSYIRENGGFENFNVEILEEFACDNSIDKRERERYYIDLLKPTLNNNLPCQTNMEWRAINKVKYNDYMKSYMKTYKK